MAPLATGQVATPESRLADALTTYTSTSLAALDATIEDAQRASIEIRIHELKDRASTISGQRSAFGELDKRIREVTGHELDPARALELRNAARESSGLPLFPGLAVSTDTRSAPIAAPVDERRLLDVDFVAIYW